MSKIVNDATRFPCVFSLQMVPELREKVKFGDLDLLARSLQEAFQATAGFEEIYNLSTVPTSVKTEAPTAKFFLSGRPLLIELASAELGLLKFITLFDVVVAELLVRNHRGTGSSPEVSHNDILAFRRCLEYRFSNTQGSAVDSVITLFTP